MGNIIIDPRWGFDSVVIGVAALIIAVISIKEPRARLFSVITIGICALICVLVFVPNLLTGLYYCAISLILSYSGFYIQEKFPTLFEIVIGIILLILGVLGSVLIIQLETSLFLTSFLVNWPIRLGSFISQLLFIILLPLIILGIRRLWKNSLLINKFSMTYKNAIVTILVICGVFFVIASIGQILIPRINDPQQTNVFKLTLLFLLDTFCFILVYCIWFKRLNFISRSIYFLLGLMGMALILIASAISNYVNNLNDFFQTLINLILVLSYFWMISSLKESRRELRPIMSSYPGRPVHQPIRRATRYLDVYDDRNQRSTLYSARDKSLNRNEPDLSMMDELNEEEPFYGSSSSAFERPRSSNSQKRNRRRKDSNGGGRRFYPRI